MVYPLGENNAVTHLRLDLLLDAPVPVRNDDLVRDQAEHNHLQTLLFSGYNLRDGAHTDHVRPRVPEHPSLCRGLVRRT